MQRRGRPLPGPALVGIGDDPALEPRRRPERIGEGAWKNGSLCPAMLDHVFTQLVAPTATPSRRALLQRQAVEERFQVDVFLGDVSFETSYSLPGEERPAADPGRHQPRLAHLEPDLLSELGHRRGARRAARGRSSRSPSGSRASTGCPRWPLLGVLPDHLDVLGDEPLPRGSTTVEQLLTEGQDRPECAIEVSYEGSCQLDETSSTTRPAWTMPSPPWAGRWPRYWCASATFPSRSGPGQLPRLIAADPVGGPTPVSGRGRPPRPGHAGRPGVERRRGR